MMILSLLMLQSMIGTPTVIRWCISQTLSSFIEQCKWRLRINGDNGNFKLIKRSSLKKGTPVLPGVWALTRKRRILTVEIYKHKACWNLDGSKQVQGRDFNKTYSPTAQWPIIHLLLVNVLINKWKTRQLNFVQAFPKAPVSHKQFVDIPKDINIQGIDANDWLFEVTKNVYGGKDDERQWYLFLCRILEEVGFVKSKIDNCLFYHGNVVFVLYTDDSIMAGPTDKEMDGIIERMKAARLQLTVDGTLADFLGVNINQESDTFTLTQPKLIESILGDLCLADKNVALKDVPMACSKLLGCHKDSEAFDGSFNYHQVIGKLNFLE